MAWPEIAKCVAQTPLGKDEFEIIRTDEAYMFSMDERGSLSLEDVSERDGMIYGTLRGIAPFPFVGDVEMWFENAEAGGDIAFMDAEADNMLISVIQFFPKDASNG